jgi:imidazole glycerol-phosphate synthase subunit HisF
MLSRNFRLQKVGGLGWLKKNYNFSNISFSIDELIILDVTRGEKDEKRFHEHVRSLASECFAPIAAGGGIRTLEHARNLLYSGADKVVVNTLIYESTDIMNEIISEFGQQSVVASVDVKMVDNKFTVWTDNGSVLQKKSVTQWLEDIALLGVGELYLNSIDRDGTGQGYQIELLDSIPDTFSIPVILSGGAGKYDHLSNGLRDKRIDAVATEHLFNFVGDGLKKMRNKLLEEGHNLPYWDAEIVRKMYNTLHTG